jgi:predicted adenylyl cyclase CyaB
MKGFASHLPKLPRKNLEFKAKCDSLAVLRRRAVALKAEYCRTMHQIDTYFNVPKGRLKLREVDDDTTAQLVYYERPDAAESRYSNYQLCDIPQPTVFKGMMSETLGVMVVVEKRRELWMFGETRIHLDEVVNLGQFLELETVIGNQTEAEARAEHQLVREGLQVKADALISVSYSDLIRVDAISQT